MSDLTQAKDDQEERLPSVKRLDDDRTWDETLVHNGANASIVVDDTMLRETPWTPKSLGRAKTAIVYKVTTCAVMATRVSGAATDLMCVCVVCLMTRSGAANTERHAARIGARLLLLYQWMGAVFCVVARSQHPDVYHA